MFNGASIQFQPFFYLHFGFFLLCILLTLYSYSHTPLSWKIRTLLLSLRSLALFSLLLILWNPCLFTQETFIEKSPLILLQDSSLSMNLPYNSTRSRYEAVQDFLKKQQELLQKLQKHYDFQHRGFHEHLLPLPSPPHGKTTHLYSALQELAQEYPGKSVEVLLFSDGATQDTPLSFPSLHLHTIRVCSPPPEHKIDICAYQFLLPDRFFEKQTFQGKLVLTSPPPPSAPTPFRIRLHLGSETQELEGQHQGTLSLIPFQWTPPYSGTFILKAEIEPLEHEINLHNNLKEQRIFVETQGLPLLYLENQFRLEQRFLLQSLSRMKAFQVHFQLVSSRLPFSAENLAPYKVLILGDLKNDIPHLASYIEKGGAVWFLATPHISQIQDWALLAPIFQEQTPPLLAAPFLQKAKKETLTFFPQLSSLDFSQLPPIPSLFPSTLRGVESTVLLETASPAYPVLIIRPFGLGRVAALTTNRFFSFVYNDLPENSYKTSYEFYQTVVRQTLLWLARCSEEERPRVSLEKQNYALGEAISVRIYSPPSLAFTFRGVLEGDQSTESQSFHYQENFWEARWFPQKTGTYRLHLQSEPESEFKGAKYQETFELQVYEPPVEQETPPQPELLKQLSFSTERKSVSLEDAQSLLEELPQYRPPLEVTRKIEKTLWDHSTLFIVFFLSLLLEWIQRKKLQLA